MVYSKVNVTELEFFLFGGGGQLFFFYLFFTKRQYVYRSKKKKSTRSKSRLLRVISMLKSQSGNINLNLNNEISIPNWEGGIRVTPPPPPVRRVEQILTILPDHSRGRWSALNAQQEVCVAKPSDRWFLSKGPSEGFFRGELWPGEPPPSPPPPRADIRGNC